MACISEDKIQTLQSPTSESGPCSSSSSTELRMSKRDAFEWDNDDIYSGGNAGAETSFSLASSEAENAKETLFEAMRSGSLAQVEYLHDRYGAAGIFEERDEGQLANNVCKKNHFTTQLPFTVFTFCGRRT